MDEHAEPVSLGDAEIAAGIARAAASGREADRRPTPEQLVAAFGEPAATEAARRRAAAALAVAGVRVEPDLRSAPAGERVLLHAPAASGGGSAGGGRSRRALAGLGAVVVVLAAGAAAAAMLSDGEGGSVGDALPAGTSETQTAPAPPTVPATTATVPPATTATATVPPTETAATTDTATAPATTTEDEPSAEERAADRRARERRRSRQRARRRAAARRRALVTVRVDGRPRPTFLCVEDGEGKVLFHGTLSTRKVFRARAVALNIGLATTIVRYGTTTVRLPGSPAGVLITRDGHTSLPLGERPCA